MSDEAQGSSISERKNSLSYPQRLVSLSKAPQDSTLLLLALRGEVKFGVEEGLSMQSNQEMSESQISLYKNICDNKEFKMPNVTSLKKTFNDEKTHPADTKRILIVDDEPINIIGMIIILKSFGYHQMFSLIDRAYNGLEALNKVKAAYQEQTHSYGLIFMDCNMPVMDGFDASDKIRTFLRKHN